MIYSFIESLLEGSFKYPLIKRSLTGFEILKEEGITNSFSRTYFSKILLLGDQKNNFPVNNLYKQVFSAHTSTL